MELTASPRFDLSLIIWICFAQLWSFSADAQAANLDRNGLAIAAEQILRKVLLFMALLDQSGQAFFVQLQTGLILYLIARTSPSQALIMLLL
jgi:hypothetical protein